MNAKTLYIKGFNIFLLIKKWLKINVLLFEEINQILLHLKMLLCDVRTNESLIKFESVCHAKSFLNYAFCKASPTTV